MLKIFTVIEKSEVQDSNYMITLEQLIKEDQDFYNINGFKGSIGFDEDLLNECLTEPSFVEAFNAATLSKKDKLTLEQLAYLFKIKNLDVKLKIWVSFANYKILQKKLSDP